ncbi:MAG: hypothetical protein KGY68_06865 [Candidatus Thermoplasmatota archaeon]|nr:hypothetical protein [Candidatus Thermoplasmatota archaeon]
MKRDVLEDAIESHNEYKSAIAEAELVDFNEDGFKVKFEGNFCLSCCMDEYFIDLIYKLEELGLEVDFVDFHQVGEKAFIAEYYTT